MPKYRNTGTKPVWLEHRKKVFKLAPGDMATANKVKNPPEWLKEIKPKK